MTNDTKLENKTNSVENTKNELEQIKKENELLKNKLEDEYALKKETISIVMEELVRLKILKPVIDPFSNTKNLLNNFNKLDKAIYNMKSEIKKLEKSKNNIDGPRITKSHFDNDLAQNLTFEIIEERILNLNQTIQKIKCYQSQIISIINDLPALDKKLIEDFYFKKIDVLDLAIEYECDQSTIYRKVNKIINEIKIELFPSKFIDSLL